MTPLTPSPVSNTAPSALATTTLATEEVVSASVATVPGSATTLKSIQPKTPAKSISQKVAIKEEKTDVEKLEALSTKYSKKQQRGLGAFLAGLNNIGLGKERTRFVENLAILLNSGLSIIDALKTIEMELRIKPMKKLIQKIIDEVESGIALWRAMDHQNFFSPYALALIRIGEEAGSLSTNMQYLAVQQEKDHALRSKVKMAMIYPSIVLFMTITITLGLAWFVLPQLVGVLISLDAKLPLVTRIVIMVSNYFRDNGSIAVPSTFGAMLGVYILCKYTPLRGPAQMFIFRFPGIGTMARCATIAQFGVILGSLMRAGVPVVESIRSMADVTDTVFYKRFYYKLATEIESGLSFGAAFEKLKESRSLLPISVQQLIITGERSGRISDMMMKVSEIYEKKAEEAAQRLPVVLEPMLLLFMGALVGTIAFAIIVPIYSVVGSVGR